MYVQVRIIIVFSDEILFMSGVCINVDRLLLIYMVVMRVIKYVSVVVLCNYVSCVLWLMLLKVWKWKWW